MSKLDKLNAKFDRLIEVMNKKNSAPAPTLQAGNATLGASQAEFNDLINKIGEGLMRAGFIPQKLDQRNAATNSADVPVSVNGPITTLYGLRQLKDKIADANFVAALPNLSAVAAAAGAAVPGGAVNDSWNVADVNTVRNEYKKLSDVINELRSLMASLQF